MLRATLRVHAMATFEGMKIPPEMKNYIKTTLEPLLEDMVPTACITSSSKTHQKIHIAD